MTNVTSAGRTLLVVKKGNGKEVAALNLAKLLVKPAVKQEFFKLLQESEPLEASSIYDLRDKRYNMRLMEISEIITPDEVKRELSDG